ncbi:MAG: hypothetical protein QW498_06695 [Thermofilum sp.]
MARMPAVVKLDRHEARKTDARTFWKVATERGEMTVEEAVRAGLLKPLFSTFSGGKTHWEEYYEVASPEVTLVRVRITNRGNLDTRKFTPTALAVSEKEIEKVKAALDP